MTDQIETNQLQPYQQRVITELAELTKKIQALNKFAASIEFDGLPDEEKELLLDQSKAMCAYSAILKKRIDRFDFL